jgi:hypothetical protein
MISGRQQYLSVWMWLVAKDLHGELARPQIEVTQIQKRPP